jgi:hypothetical protein
MTGTGPTTAPPGHYGCGAVVRSTCIDSYSQDPSLPCSVCHCSAGRRDRGQVGLLAGLNRRHLRPAHAERGTQGS